jgi:hypothetical protein
MEYMQALSRWQELTATIKHLQSEERTLREGLFAGTFPSPEEGTNTYELPDGRIVKGTYKLNRKLLEDALPAVLKKLKMAKKDAPIRTKVELDLKGYRDLSDKDRHVFDEALDIKPALPTLEVVQP